MSATAPPIRFAAIGLDHPHIIGMALELKRAGAELAALVPQPGPLGEGFQKLFGEASVVDDARQILDDPGIDLVACAGIPNERAPLGIEVLRAGKDFLVDKPGFTDLDQLEQARALQRETGRFYTVHFSERLSQAATSKASELVAQGAIGRVMQTVGLGPHRLNADQRPDWFFERERYGGILTDLASHQADQFLFFTSSRSARVVASHVANHAHPEYPGLEDFGEMLLEGEGATGYARVDWFTPAGMPTWGDGRLVILGTEGTIEIRKEVDLAGREGGNHLFLADAAGVRHVDCSGVEPPFAAHYLDDVRNRTELAMSQAHSFLASELALRAQAQAERIAPRKPAGRQDP